MSHLGDLLSALVDGELNGAELDRANAHLAACGACQGEAGALRRLKHELHDLAGACDADGLTRRLLAMDGREGPEDPWPGRYPGREYDEHGERRKGRYVLWSTVSLVVVGIGAAAFGLGGGSGGSPAPRITPQLEMYDWQHAVTSGDVPFGDPSQRPARLPAVAASP
ncbi:MAG TPA: anti-sigma factor [Trebonia sp.]